MGQIKEELILTDQFGGTFERFLSMGEQSIGKMGAMDQAGQRMARSMELSARQLGAMKDALASQRVLHMDQIKELQMQGDKVAALAQRYEQLAGEKGRDVAATVKAGQALARAQIAEQNMLQQSLKTEQAILRQGQAIEKFAAKMAEADRTAPKTADTIAKGMDRAASSASKMAKVTDAARSAQDRLGDAVKKTDDVSKSLLSTFGRVASVIGGIKLGSGLISLSDTMAQTNARLGMVIDDLDGGMGDVLDLQEELYRSAQRTRGAYQDTADAVSKLGLMAGDAFESSGEIVAFMEQINKQFKIAGTEASGIQAAMLQLTQAMGSGVLRGEEYNSILEQAPNIIQTIADYLDVPKGKLKDMAAEGKITADIVKAAMFAAAEETDAKFAAIPMTFSDAWTMVKNAGVDAISEVSAKLNGFLNSDTGLAMVNGMIQGFELLSDIAGGAIDLMAAGATFVVENWDYVLPILIGVGVAFAAAGMAGMVSGIAAMAGWGPVGLVLLGIGVGIAALTLGLSQAGVSFEQMGAVGGGVMGGLYSVAYTAVAYMWNIFATFAEFFANVFNDPVAAIANLFAGLLDAILRVVQTAASAIDALLGSDISGAVAGFRDDVRDFVETTYGENEVKIERMGPTDVGEDIAKGSQLGKEFGKKLDDLDISIDGLAESFGGGADLSAFGKIGAGGLGDIGKVGSVGKVKDVEGEIHLADEDLKLYQDLAERRYLNQIELKTLAPNINVTLPAGASGNLTADDVADRIKAMLIQQMSAQTAISHG